MNKEYSKKSVEYVWNSETVWLRMKAHDHIININSYFSKSNAQIIQLHSAWPYHQVQLMEGHARKGQAQNEKKNQQVYTFSNLEGTNYYDFDYSRYQYYYSFP